MRIVVLRKEQVCTICRLHILPNEEAIMFYNANAYPRMHFRHPQCQYKKFARLETFEKYMQNLRYMEEMRKTKQYVATKEQTRAEKIIEDMNNQ